ncbi:MAG TPA: alpha/beta fold hydrolase [Acidimicrobiales bacterium]|jgi:carboxylesterase|nr:alpha/beta fold hydrolase [Acidimicrobiales bacterium]
MTELMPGAEPWSVAGGPAGALCLHGFTGNPTSMRPVAKAFAAAGFTVELPRLPGHGTAVEDMMATGWAGWTEAAEAVYDDLAARCERVVVSGLSMGGSLTLWLASRHPEIAGLVCVNPAVVPQPPEVVEMVRGMLAEGQDRMPGIGSDIADPDAVESSYSETPLGPLLSLMDGLAELQPHLGRITSPLLLMTSTNDHVVTPTDSDALAAAVSGPVERITLERSYHVATLDYDAALVTERAVAFARKVTSA